MIFPIMDLSQKKSDGNGLSEHIEKYIEWDGEVVENLDFG